MGSSLSLFDYANLGSSLALRSMCRLGSQLSLVGLLQFGATVSVLDGVHVGSSLSLRCISRLGSTLSVLGISRVGSSLALLSLSHMGASLSLRSFARMGAAISVLGMMRMGASLAILDIACLGSSMALRQCARLGSSFSVFSSVRFGSTLSVCSFAFVGSSLSLRNLARIGSSISLLGIAKFGSDLHFTTTDAAIYGAKTGGTTTRRISFPEDSIGSGTLHGIWSADQPVSLSDRRMKTNIAPLHRTLYTRMEALEVTKPSDSSPRSGASKKLRGRPVERSAAVDWVLRELRPVSFSFRKAAESKAVLGPRYGFVAQDVERVLPELVHNSGDTKYMIYQDLIAMITMVVQDLQARLEHYHADVFKLQSTVEGLDAKLESLQGLLLERSRGSA